MIQVNRIYLIFNRLVTKKFLVDTSDFVDKELRIYSIKQNNTITQRKAVSKRKQFFYIIYKFYVRQWTNHSR